MLCLNLCRSIQHSRMKEDTIENNLIAKLSDLKYVYRNDIKNRETLELNFRQKFEDLNRVRLTDSEFARLRDEIITPNVYNAAQKLRSRNTFIREDGTPLQYTLVNIREWCKNEFEVVRQLRSNTENSYHRYDVILLLNGIPVVQIELKTLEISPRRAIEQIVEYKKDKETGYKNSLLCFIQIFVVSNQTNTYYFANNNDEHFNFNAEEQFLPIYQFAEVDNRKITRLEEFADKFLSKCSLGQTISRYMVLVATEQKLLMMRPYQIYAVKAIMESIHENRGNGFIWHTTGSGKTLTSFKASTLLKDNSEIHKCLFVVDRKDLDRQTRDEFNKFQEGCVEENTNTEALVERLLSDDYADKVIVTTIQKLGIALDPNARKQYKQRLAPLSDKRIVFIFDECHRSQFGENHKAIIEFFPKAQLFGFTGTPIFKQNATYVQVNGEEASLKTTEDVFQNSLHAYTITHAIDDRNVLRFHIDYFKPEGKNPPPKGEPLARQAVVEAILAKHDTATLQRRFNAILATASINDAIDYYRLFKEVQAQRALQNPDFVPLRVACVFSPPADGNKDTAQRQEDLQQERIDNQQNPEEKKQRLSEIIADYNRQYSTNHRIQDFDLYYKDVQQRIKNQKIPNSDKFNHKDKIDVTIVVDMLLTGFDSQYLNTLYVDKNLRFHGLIQAFSRTNRILNDTKPYGNILDFRQQEEAVNEAIQLFSGLDVNRAKEIWIVESAEKVFVQYQQAVAGLEQFMQAQGLPCLPQEVNNLKGDKARMEFVQQFKEVQRIKTQLDQYTDLSTDIQTSMETLLPETSLRAFKGAYLDVAQRLKPRRRKKTSESDADLQQLDFEFVLFASAVIDYDYIMELIARYTQQKKSDRQTMSQQELIELLSSSANLLEDREDMKAYIEQLDENQPLTIEQIHRGFQQFKNQKTQRLVHAVALKHGLNPTTLYDFVCRILDRRIFDGEQLTDLLAPLDLGWKARTQKELALMEDLSPLLKDAAKGEEISGLSIYDETTTN